MATEVRRLAAIVFSDICGFSTTMGVDEKKALSYVELHNDVVEAGSSEYGGRVIKKMGDGLMVEFPSAVNAVRFALAVQSAINEYNTKRDEDDRVFIRIGIHLGDVVVSEGGDLLGDGVNVASRIEPLAEPGGICISRDILDLVQNKMAIQTVHLGAKELKNISKQIDIYKVLIDAVVSEGTSAKRSRGRRRSFALRKWILGAAIVAGVILLLLALGAHARRRNAKRAFETTTDTAKELVDKGEFTQALEVIDSYPAKFEDLPWQAELDKIRGKLAARAAEQTVRRRCAEFFQALDAMDWDKAVNYLDPSDVREQGAERIRGKLKFMTSILKLGGLSAGGVKILHVDLDKDRATASLTISVRRKTPQGETKWHTMPEPSRWQLLNDQWYTAPEQKTPEVRSRQPASRRPKDSRDGRRPGMRR